jgi:sorbitol/mannitol transport system permease protein
MAITESRVERAEGRRAGGSLARWIGKQPLGRLLILPALIYAIVVTQAPFILTVWYSFQRWNLQRPDRRDYFIGLDNYRTILTRDPAFREAVVNTVIFVVAAVLLSLLLGLLYAELVNHRFPGRGVVRTLLITPFLIMPVAAALTWKNMMLNPNFGVIDWVIDSALPGNPAPNWLGHYPEVSIIGVLVWRWAPFMMLILLAGMQSISEEVREAARVDGATLWQEFRDITLPHLYRFLQLGGLLGTVFILQEVDPIYMMTKGGPGNATTTLPYLVFRKAIEGSNVGLAAAVGVIVVILSIIVITLLLRTLDRMMRGL